MKIGDRVRIVDGSDAGHTGKIVNVKEHIGTWVIVRLDGVNDVGRNRSFCPVNYVQPISAVDRLGEISGLDDAVS